MNRLRNSIADISNNHYKYLSNIQNVNGIGYGYKYINDKNTFEPCIRVLVENKISLKYLTKDNVIPKRYMGIKTDVIEIGEINLTNQSKEIPLDEPPQFIEKTRPLRGGASIGPNNEYSAGTLCCIVSKITKGEKEFFLLSNNHVLANKNKLPIGIPIVQPAYPLVEEDKVSIIANLADFIAINFISKDSDGVNIVDCAIAKVSKDVQISRYIVDIGAINGVEEATLGMNVQKFGFVSGFSEGYVDSLYVTIPHRPDKNYSYKKQIVSKIKTLSGDSGCAIVNEDNNIIGMHMSSTGKGFSVANDINLVLKELKVDIYLGE